MDGSYPRYVIIATSFSDLAFQVAVEEAEYGSAMRPGSKKGNWNHLLNFTFAPRESSEMGWGGRGGHWKGRNKWSWKSTVKYNKEQYLQAK